MMRAFIILALCTSLAISEEAVAVRQNRVDDQTAVNNCRAALPNFEGNLRKRPLGIFNEGPNTAFLSCAMSSETFNSTGITQVTATLSNRGAAAASISCTLVDGRPAPIGTPSFFPATSTLAPGGSRDLTWTQVMNGGARFETPSMTCALPSAVELNETKTFYDTDVGL